MLNKTSKTFRTSFLLSFTRELIRNSENAEAIALKKRLREKIKENVEKKENEERLKKIVEKKAITEELKEISEKRIPESIRTQIKTRIPQPSVPSTIRNILPSVEEQQLDLGKLNPLIKDPTVISVECDGPDKNIIIRRIRGEKRITNIVLNEQEIKEIISIFSGAAKIPSHEGIFKAAVGKLIISAVISDVIGGRFLITKLSPFEYYGR